MVSTQFGSLLTVLVIGVCLLHPVLAGDDGKKMKKVIIKVPQLIKHIHHHHVKKVHVYEEEPKKEFHYGPFSHYHDSLSNTKGLEGWTSGYNTASTEGEWKFPKTLDDWNNYFKKGIGGDFEGHDESIVGKFEGGEAWKESDDSYGLKGNKGWGVNWVGERLGGGTNGEYESNQAGGYDEDSQMAHMTYELPLGAHGVGKLGEMSQQSSLGTYGENSFEGGYGDNYKLDKKKTRDLHIGTDFSNFGTMRQPDIKNIYEPSEYNKQSDCTYSFDMPSLKQNRGVGDNMEHILLRQNADNSHFSGQHSAMQSYSDWMSLNGERK